MKPFNSPRISTHEVDFSLKKIRLILIFLLFLITASDQLFAQADWVYFGPDNKLVYKTDALGNHIVDFSHAGYMGGGVAIPDVPVKVTLNSTGGDQTAAIQAAINQVSALPLVDGFRGAVLLGPDTFRISNHIVISASGVVLRGSGMGAGGTVIFKTSNSPTVKLQGVSNQTRSNKVSITDTFIPSGANSFTVTDASAFQVGDQVVVNRVVTAEWVKYVKMDSLYRNGAKQTWLSVGTTLRADRVIKSISGNTITLDVPLIDSYDSKYLGTPVASIEKYSFPGRITQVGLENLMIKGPVPGASGHAVDVSNVIDGWVRNVHCIEGRNTVNALGGTKRFTFDHVIVTNPVEQTNSAAPEDFQLDGAAQVLFNKCEAHTRGDWGFLTQSGDTGPFVILNCHTDSRGVNPHQRWTVGILADGGFFGGSTGVDWVNRTTAGSGHGWTTGWSVAWNVTTPRYTNEAAPGTMNWVIGGTGSLNSTTRTKGITDHLGTTVKPNSLYLQQLLERLGPQALYNIGYTPFDAVRTLEVKITSPQNGAIFSSLPANINIAVQSSDDTHGVAKVEFYHGATKLGEDLTSPYNFAWNNVPAGTYTLTAKATNGAGNVVTSTPVTVTVSSQRPYLGILRSIPGKIEAEDYDEGGQGIAYNDNTAGNNYNVYRFESVDIQPTGDVGGGYNLALVATGEWVEYTINVEVGGTYQLDLRLAATTSTRALHVEMDGVNITGRVAVPNTGAFQVYKTVSIITPVLTPGKKVMRVFLETPSLNLNWLNFTVQRRTQSITFNDIEDATYGDQLKVVATADSELPVSIEVVSGPAVFENELLKIIGVGDVKLRATQAGNESYLPASAELTFTVEKAPQVITLEPVGEKTYGDAAFDLNATVDSGLPLTFSVVTGPATIAGTTVTITGAGEVTVQVSQEGNENYLPASVQQTFVVNKAAQIITLEPVGEKTYGDDPFDLNATVNTGLPLTFAIGAGPATIAGSTVTITGAGEVTVQVSQEGNENYLPASVDQTFIVNKASQTITFESILPKDQSEIVELSAVSSSGLPVSFEVISGHGLLTGNTLTFTGEGEVVIEATQSGNENYLPASSVQQMILVFADDSKYDAIKLNVHPNPTKWKLKVKLENKKDAEYLFVIYDRFGKPVASTIIPKSHKMFEVYFDMSSADEGLYFLRVSDGTDVSVRRIIKE